MGPSNSGRICRHELEAVEPRHHDVAEHEVEAREVHPRDRRRVRCLDDLMAIAAEDARECVEDRPFIIHCQYPRHVRPPETLVGIVLAPRSAVQSPARSRGRLGRVARAVAHARAAARLDFEPAFAVRLPPEEDELELSDIASVVRRVHQVDVVCPRPWLRRRRSSRGCRLGRGRSHGDFRVGQHAVGDRAQRRPQPASSRAFPPRTSAAERRASTAANGFLRICPPVLEAAEPGDKDGGGC